MRITIASEEERQAIRKPEYSPLILKGHVLNVGIIYEKSTEIKDIDLNLLLNEKRLPE